MSVLRAVNAASTLTRQASYLFTNLGLAVPVRFAGHSKWAKIARTKGANDAARAQLFSKLGLAIAAAARVNPDPASNLRLQACIEKAKQANCPKDIIDRALSQASSRGEGVEEVVFEGMGPANVGVIIETLTNKKARTAVGLKRIFSNHGVEGPGGSVAFMFASKGRVTVPMLSADDEAAQERLLEVAMEGDAEDVEFLSAEDSAAAMEGQAVGDPAEPPAKGLAYVWTAPAQVHAVRKAIEAAAGKGFKAPTAAELVKKPTVTAEVSEEDQAGVMAFIADLEDHEDVQTVYHNAA
jgi:YebC/PmpR family DNA-binding regulatory protein